MTKRLVVLASLFMLTAVGCGASDSSGGGAVSVDANGNDVGTPTTSAEGSGDAVTSSSVVDSSAVEGGEPTAETVDAGAAMAALERLAMGEPGTSLEECPFGDLRDFPAPSGELPAFDDVENMIVNDTGVRCTIRVSDDSAQFTAISVEASFGALAAEEYFASGNFMVPVSRVPLAGGELVTECPREQTQGDVPEHCEATWIAPESVFIVEYHYSGPGTSAQAVAIVLSGSLSTILERLAAA